MTGAEFDTRYRVEPAPDGSWHVSDTQRRCIEAGPWRNQRTADEVCAFMRQHCEVETTWSA